MITARTLSSTLVALGFLLLCQSAYADDSAITRCVTANAASIQSDNLHQLRAERAQLLVCAAAECPLEVRTECLRRVEEVNLAIPTVVFEARDAAGNDLSAVAVTMDGEALSERLDGVALSIDPGAHQFTFAAAGKPPLRKQFVIREGQKNRYEQITIYGPRPVERAAWSGVGSPDPAQTQDRRGGATTLGAQKVWAISLAGLGIAGVAVGTVFAADALSKRDQAEKACPAACPDSRGVELWHEARTTGNRATVAFVAGGALLAGAGLLWLTLPDEHAARHLELGLGAGTLNMRSQW